MLTELTTDCSNASGTAHWGRAATTATCSSGHSATTRSARVCSALSSPPVARPTAILVGPGAGDNAAAALGLDAHAGDVVVPLGTSGTVFAVTDAPTADATGTVAGFADATGAFLPLIATLNAARVLDAVTGLLGVVAGLLGVSHDELGRLALEAEPGASGAVLVPCFEGERAPNLPHARALLTGLSLANTTRAGVARAALEGMLCGLADGLDAVRAQGLHAERILLIGGAAQNFGMRSIAAPVFDLPVVVPANSEYVAGGAARQAAWALTGERPDWALTVDAELALDTRPVNRSQYAEAARAHTEG